MSDEVRKMLQQALLRVLALALDDFLECEQPRYEPEIVKAKQAEVAGSPNLDPATDEWWLSVLDEAEANTRDNITKEDDT
jgi:hypothetical protein